MCLRAHRRKRVCSGETLSSCRHGAGSTDGRSSACQVRAAQGRTHEGCKQGYALNFLLISERKEQVSSGIAAISRRLAAGQQGAAGILLFSRPSASSREDGAWGSFEGAGEGGNTDRMLQAGPWRRPEPARVSGKASPRLSFS